MGSIIKDTITKLVILVNTTQVKREAKVTNMDIKVIMQRDISIKDSRMFTAKKNMENIVNSMVMEDTRNIQANTIISISSSRDIMEDTRRVENTGLDIYLN